MTASLIVFVEVMKDFPATLILRQFGMETLVTHVYQYASSEQLAPAFTRSFIDCICWSLAGFVV